ncbi:ribonuclease H-like domain-containing protein [Tanacetum coccineum]
MITHFRVKTNCPLSDLNVMCLSRFTLPSMYTDAFNDLNPNLQNVMCDEYNALIKNKTWTLVPRPTDTNIVRYMWLFRHKYLADGTLTRYKARLVANDTIRIVLNLATSRHWPVHHLDVKNAFLHGDLSETIYMSEPLGFRDPTHPDYEVLSQMLELKLETEEESSMALELIKFVRQQLEEFEDSNDDDTVTSTHEDEERV